MKRTARKQTAQTRTARTARIILSALLPLALGFTGCGDHLPEAFGPNPEVLVLADSTDVQWLHPPLKSVFERTLVTPQEEQVYWLDYGNLRDLDHHRRRTNLLIAAVLDEPTPASELIGGLLSPQVKESVRAGEAGGIIWKHDVWAENQLVMIVTGRDSTHLVSNLRTDADRLFAAMEDARNERTGELIYKYGERKDVAQELEDKYGWTIRVPFGYRILEEKPDSNFVVLVKEEPARWFFVYWEDGVNPADLTPDWCIDKRNEITRKFFGGDRIALGDVTVRETDFAGKLAVQMTGLWENEEHWSGGPFRSYSFVDFDTGRFYHVDMGVYAPNKRKEPYLRQVDLMARSFSIERTVATP